MKLRNPEIRVEVTNRCAYQCTMCPREKQTRPLGDMTLEMFERISDQAGPLGVDLITLVNYGEPFLDPTFFDKVKYCKTRYPQIALATVTTGAPLDQEKCDALIELGFDYVRFSYYGVVDETYRKIHRVKDGYFEHVTGIIEYLLEKKRSMRSNLPRVEVYFLQLPENAHETERFKQRWEARADGISIWTPHNWSNGRRYRQLSEERLSCGRPANGPLQVMWNGDVVPCCFDYNAEIVLGNVMEEPLESILRGARYGRLREAHRAGAFHLYPFCDTCDQLNRHQEGQLYSNIAHSRPGASNTNRIDLRDEFEDGLT